MTAIRLLGLDELAPGSVRRVVVRGEEYAVARAPDGTPHVVTDICPHGHCSLGNGGMVRDYSIVCPCHGSAFDLATGAVLSPPAVYPLRVYPAEVREGAVWVER